MAHKTMATKTTDAFESIDREVWEGPFKEINKYGASTGCSYVRCRSCGIEILTGRKDFASHRDGCQIQESH